MVLYKCCEHCLGHPEDHMEKDPDWHEFYCTIPSCIVGRQAVQS